MTKITIGARGSKLSLAYVEKVKELLVQKNKGLKEENINFKSIKTSGDIHQNVKLSEIGGKNLFCKEIEEQLLNREINIAVHSLKDMETVENDKLIIGAYIKRNDFRDVIISNKIKSLNDLKEKKIVIGSSSRRRELQLKKINRNISVSNMRGNIDTRIKKVADNELDAIILAAAGVKTLNLNNKISLSLEINEVLPAVGQGIIAVQCNKDDNASKIFLRNINDKETELCAKAERKMLQTIGGDCETAVGGLAVLKNNNIKLKAQLFSDTGLKSFEYEFSGEISDAELVGKTVGEKLLSIAGKEFKKMNILITRPLIDSEDLMGKLFSLGHKIIHIPTLRILKANIAPIDAKKYGAFIFTSSNAFRNLKLIEDDNTKTCFCVGAITEKIVRLSGYRNTISAGGTVNALKNIILNSDQIDKRKSIAYFCGDYISSNLDTELKDEGFQIDKIINYTSEKITDLNEENNKIINNHPPVFC